MKNNFELFPSAPATESTERKKSPEKIMSMLKFLVDHTLNKFEVKGKEHLQEIPEGKKIIVAASHATDYDMPYAYYALGNDLKLRFTRSSQLEKFIVDPLTAGVIRYAGEENFLPVTYRKGSEESGRNEGQFNPDDYIKMMEATEEGDALLVAAHRPSNKGELSEYAGYADVYLAQMTDGVVVPVAINIESKTPAVTIGAKIKSIFQKSDATASIGEPLSFPKIPGIEQFGDLIRKHKSERLTPEEQADFHRIHMALKEQSHDVMKHIAEMMPEEKRGAWQERFSENKEAA